MLFGDFSLCSYFNVENGGEFWYNKLAEEFKFICQEKNCAIYFRDCIISANKVEIILSDCSIILTKAGEQKWMSI